MNNDILYKLIREARVKHSYRAHVLSHLYHCQTEQECRRVIDSLRKWQSKYFS
jgi:hypothetical protein